MFVENFHILPKFLRLIPSLRPSFKCIRHCYTLFNCPHVEEVLSRYVEIEVYSNIKVINVEFFFLFSFWKICVPRLQDRTFQALLIDNGS